MEVDDCMSKWCCTVIHKDKEGYRAILTIDGYKVEDLPEYVGYNELRNAIKRATGIEILQRKDMIFEKLSDCEQIATIDNTQYRGEGKDCRVRLVERQNGWKPKWDEY